MDNVILVPGEFLSTLSLRRATEPENQIIAYDNDFYPRSPCGERLYFGLFFCRHAAISIHALLAESDGGAFARLLALSWISIHALLAESDARQ